ncbi:unnamed protein product [Porites lobata]|uniref:Transposase domain-containing protein n=1 Tax=Porites lobata TaxID=104759 RepID=A0ABN8RU58_9CNID|nr:unnamed protein product [Porites lobata]
MYLASCSSYQDLDHELSDVLSESTHDDDSVEKTGCDLGDISEDDRSSTSSDDDQFCARGDSYNHIRSKSTDEEDPVYVYPGSPLLLSESILLILTLAVAHNLNGSCLSDVISLINLHCIPGPLNKCVNSLSELKRYFADFELPITKHFYCSSSIWPVYFEINELPPSKRKRLENMLLGGLCVPCLVGVLPDVYLHHFMLLAFSVWLVNQQTISPEEVNQSGNLLAKFVMLMDALYSERHMTINIHNLLHIHASVHNLGPLWANSTFDFEDANGELTALFHGTQNIDMQIASSVSAVKIAPDLARKLDKDSPSYSLYRRMKFGKEQKSTKLEDGVHLLGAFTDFEVPETIEQHIKDFTGDLALGRCQSFKRAIIRGEVFHSKSYGRVSRRNSYTVTYEDSQKRRNVVKYSIL